MSETKSLTTPPTNLKETIDWLALVGGGYGGNDVGARGKSEALKKALKKLQGFDDTAFYNHNFGDGGLSVIIDRYAQALNSGFLGYNDQNSGTVSGGSYTSAYYNADWNSNEEPTYARIFLFLACLAFYFITFLYWMCKGKWANQMTGHGALGEFLTAMGFPSNLLNPSPERLGTQTETLLTDRPNAGFPELSEAYTSDSSYSTFIEKLKKRAGPSEQIYVPLTNCMMLSYAYLKSRHSGTDITQAIDAIKTELVSLSTSLTSSSTFATDYFSKLKKHISSLLDKIQSFDPNAVPSPVAPLAGTLTTLAAAGGAGAAYGLNLFGLQGIVKALFGFK